MEELQFFKITSKIWSGLSFSQTQRMLQNMDLENKWEKIMLLYLGCTDTCSEYFMQNTEQTHLCKDNYTSVRLSTRINPL